MISLYIHTYRHIDLWIHLYTRAFEPRTPDMINLPLAIVELKHHLVDVGRAVLCRWSRGSQRLQRMSHVKQDYSNYSMAKRFGRYISKLMHAEVSASFCKITWHLEDRNYNALGYSTNESHYRNFFDYGQEVRIHVFGSEILRMFESFLNLRSNVTQLAPGWNPGARDSWRGLPLSRHWTIPSRCV